MFNLALRVTFHPAWRKLIVEKERPVPINVEINPTDFCNAKCPSCFYKTKDKCSEISTETLNRLILELKTLGVSSITWSGGGEPTLHASFPELVEAAAPQIKQGLFTNALKIPEYDPSKLEWVRITITNRPLNIESIKRLRDSCKKVGLVVNYDGNMDSVFDAVSVGHRMSLDYVQIRPALPVLGEKIDIKMPDIKDEIVSIQEYKFQEARTADRGYTKCRAFHFNSFVMPNGDVSPCPYLNVSKKYAYGNVERQTFADALSKAPDHFDVCSDCQVCCKAHELNKLIDAALSLDDIDFV